MTKKLDKRQRIFNEDGSRHLMALDAIQLSTEKTSEEQLKRNREKRKALINGIESLLSQNDANMRRLEELTRICLEEENGQKFLDDPSFKRLVDYEEAKLNVMQKTFDELGKDLIELEKRCMDKARHAEMTKKLDKRQRIFNEEGSRHMVALDAIQLSIEQTSEEQLKRNREKRKALINGIESLLNQNDVNMRRLEELARICEDEEN